MLGKGGGRSSRCGRDEEAGMSGAPFAEEEVSKEFTAKLQEKAVVSTEKRN